MINHVVLQRIAGTSVIRKVYQKKWVIVLLEVHLEFLFVIAGFVIEISWHNLTYEILCLISDLILGLCDTLWCHHCTRLCFNMTYLISFLTWRTPRHSSSAILLYFSFLSDVLTPWWTLDTDRTISLVQLILYDKLDTYACTRTTRMDFVHNSSRTHYNSMDFVSYTIQTVLRDYRSWRTHTGITHTTKIPFDDEVLTISIDSISTISRCLLLLYVNMP